MHASEKASRWGEGGFTLLETVIAMCVMMIAGLGIVSLFVFATKYNSGASDRARSLALAQERMERLRSTPYANLGTVAAAADFNGKVTTGSSNANEADAHTFNVVTTVEDDPNVAASRQKRITVSVTPAVSGGWAGAVSLRMCSSQNVTGTN
jgi:Tfp pilus assembly protein PilV